MQCNQLNQRACNRLQQHCAWSTQYTTALLMPCSRGPTYHTCRMLHEHGLLSAMLPFIHKADVLTIERCAPTQHCCKKNREGS